MIILGRKESKEWQENMGLEKKVRKGMRKRGRKERKERHENMG